MTTQPCVRDDVGPHSVRIRGMLDELIRDVWRGIDRGQEPTAQALFEKTAEVLTGLKADYERYEAGANDIRRN